MEDNFPHWVLQLPWSSSDQHQSIMGNPHCPLSREYMPWGTRPWATPSPLRWSSPNPTQLSTHVTGGTAPASFPGEAQPHTPRAGYASVGDVGHPKSVSSGNRPFRRGIPRTFWEGGRPPSHRPSQSEPPRIIQRWAREPVRANAQLTLWFFFFFFWD